MASLTDRQRSELNCAIYEYLMSQGDKYGYTLEQFRQEANIPFDIEIGKAVLEKKWTSVIRLQKRLMEVETKLEQLQQLRKFGSDSDAPSSSQMQILKIENRFPKIEAPPKFRLCGHRASITVVTTHPTFTLVASGSEDASIKLWDFESGQLERTLKGHTSAVTGLAFSSRGLYLGSSSADTSAKLWDMNTYTCVRTFKGHDHTVSQLKFFNWNNEEQLVTCSRDHSLKIWNIATGFCVRTFMGHTDWVKTISVSLEAKYLASGGHDQSILVWSLSTGEILQTLRGHEHVIETVCYGKKPVEIVSSNCKNELDVPDTQSTEFNYLVSGSRDRTIRLWDTFSGSCLCIIRGHENWVREVIFHATNKYIISCSDDKTIKVFELKEGRCVRTIADAHSHFVSCISMSSTYPIITSGSVDKNVCIWVCH